MSYEEPKETLERWDYYLDFNPTRMPDIGIFTARESANTHVRGEGWDLRADTDCRKRLRLGYRTLIVCQPRRVSVSAKIIITHASP
jgi:hypothetical protein